MIGRIALSLALLPVAAVPAQAQGGVAPSLGSGGAAPASAPRGGGPNAGKRTRISPYIEIGQAVAADLTDGDVVTFTQLTAGIDASVTTRRVQVQANYQYQRYLGWGDNGVDGQVHSGLARGTVQLSRDLILDAGAIATRARADARGGGFGPLLNRSSLNSSQVYSLFAGPTFARRAGPLTVNAAYRFGYTKAEAPGFIDLTPGQRRLDIFDESTSHLVTGSIGTRPGSPLPIGLTLSGAGVREDASQLDQQFVGAFGRLDGVLPVSRTVALVGGVGYEKIEVSQRDPLRDKAGNIVTDESGRFVTDPDSPPRIAYDTDGLIWDAGVLWRPSPRTRLEARVGRRYGSMIYTGSFSSGRGEGAGFQISVYDAVTTFGRQLTGSLGALPTSYFGGSDPFGSAFGGCVFGGGQAPDGAPQPGGCLTPAFQSINSAPFRARGIDAIWAVSRGGTRLGVGAGYSNRRYYLPPIPGTVVYRGNDESYYIQGFGQWAIDRRSGFTADLYGNYFVSGIADAPDVWGGGAQGSYFRSFGRAYGSLSAGLYGFDVEGGDADLVAQALLAMGVRF
ncbi:hypothetical protein [Sphingomonas sp. VNH70]|uniref:hypothetical protein n=1 Tax=Sphingomonas silueang TaxID=3156617 RepID=UPI0032B58AA8